MEDVEQLAGAGPKQLGSRPLGKDFDGSPHHGNGVHPCIGNAASKHRNDGRGVYVQRGCDATNLFQGQQCGHVQSDAVARQAPHQRHGREALGVGHGNFYIHIAAPGGDQTRLAFHACFIVSKHFKRDRQVGDGGKNRMGKCLEVLHTGLPHQRRIGSKAFDIGFAVHR